MDLPHQFFGDWRGRNTTARTKILSDPAKTDLYLCLIRHNLSLMAASVHSPQQLVRPNITELKAQNDKQSTN